MSDLPVPVLADGLPPAGTTWAQATIAGGLVHVSGQVGLDAEGRIAGATTAEQAEQVFANLRLVLEAAGSSLDRLARICAYLVSPDDVTAFRAVRDDWLANCRPASTLVIVAALVDPALRVEVDAVATVGH